MDQDQFTLLEALRLGAAQPAETRLYRSGKVPGLFPARTSVNTALASQAVREGLIEVARTETKGKATVEWVRVTQQGIDFLLQHDSPAHALDELRELLRMSHDGTPAWVAELRGRLDAVTKALLAEVEAVSRRLDQVAERVTSAIERLEGAHAPGHLPTWTGQAVSYVEQRAHSLPDSSCSLAELFAALRTRGVELSIKDYHTGLRRLHESGKVKLVPEANGTATEPEFALLDGATVYHFVASRDR